MKKKIWITAMAAASAVLGACSGGAKETAETAQTTAAESAAAEETGAQAQGEIGSVTVEEIRDKEIQLIDVRSEEQYIGWKTAEGEGGHMEGAVDFPESWLSMDLEKESAIGTTMELELERRGLDRSKETVLYGNGTVSEETAKKYQELGFEDLSVLEGGYEAYLEDGGEAVSLPGYQMYVSPQWVQDLADGKNPESYDGNDFQIVEVSLASETEEYGKGHLPGAVNVNADAINHVPGLALWLTMR